jgi:hypothetical protein
MGCEQIRVKAWGKKPICCHHANKQKIQHNASLPKEKVSRARQLPALGVEPWEQEVVRDECKANPKLLALAGLSNGSKVRKAKLRQLMKRAFQRKAKNSSANLTGSY